MIEIRDLSAGYEGKEVLTDVNLTIHEHDFLGIIGPNGGGKTTLIRCILGLLKPKFAMPTIASSSRLATCRNTIAWIVASPSA